jgi:hypothetical protein
MARFERKFPPLKFSSDAAKKEGEGDAVDQIKAAES